MPTPANPTSPVTARQTHPLGRLAREPRQCIWELTLACNLRCAHCNNHARRASPRELSFEQQLAVARELRTLGCRTVDVTGGEPLLAPRWDALCAELSELGMHVALVTNGTLLDDEAMARAVDAGVRKVAVSIDGLVSTHDAIRQYCARRGSPFEGAVHAIERAARSLPVAVITQVNRRNLAELPRLGWLLGELGVEHWQLQLAVPVQCGALRPGSGPRPFADQTLPPEELPSLVAFIVASSHDARIPPIHTSDTIGYATAEELTLRSKGPDRPGVWLGCVAGLRAVAIKYDGTVRGCSLMPRDFDAGDLHEESLSTIWNDTRRFAYTTEFDRSRLSGACARCRFGSLCRAGCTTMAYFTSGTTGNNPYCLRRVRGLVS
jgi:radical SAM protein with 4Fe4S-binding SPASM domain